MSKEKVTTIQIATETREELKTLGSKGETYDKIIRRLLSAHTKKGDEDK